MERQIDRSLSIKGFLGFFIVSMFFYGTAGLVTYPVIGGWFADLQKPSWNPPNELFGPVWGVLFSLMAIAGWVIWKQVGIKNGKKPLGLFLLQMILNLGWSITFFRFNSLEFALPLIVLLWLTVGTNVIMFFRIRRLAGILLLPYLSWITFATVLTYSYRVLNI
jgi:translocator protein